jgi:hypothetical protein
MKWSKNRNTFASFYISGVLVFLSAEIIPIEPDQVILVRDKAFLGSSWINASGYFIIFY